jgi:putative transcriptional regulator
MYHYTECGLQNVWLENGYTIQKTPYGKGVSIQDVQGLHRLIGRALARRPKLTGAELRFLRKELGISQSALADLVGTSEQNVSLWERRGKMPRGPDRLVKVIYLEQLDGNVQVRKIIERLNNVDDEGKEKLRFKERSGRWKEAA